MADYIIIGAGSGGAVLTNRLSANPNVQVTVIEAGGWDRSPWIHMPMGYFRLMQTLALDWGYYTVPQKHVNNRVMFVPRAKSIGGCTTVNGMIYTRGHRSDYDAWAQMGNKGWDYDSILPYFRKAEDWGGGGEEDVHGFDGPLKTTRNPIQAEPCVAWRDACIQAGYPYNEDLNSGEQYGVGPCDGTVRDGVRSSVSRCYISPIKKRKNLNVITKAMVSRIIVKGGRAVGVEYVQGREKKTVYADKDVSQVSTFLHSMGITSFQNMDGSLYQLELLDEIEKTEGLPMRVRMPYHMKNFMPLSDLNDKAAVWRERYDTDRLRCNFVKMFADGVVESGTAVMVGGYGDKPEENGEPLFSAEQFNEIAAEADRLGLQIAVHAIGSGAVREVLDAYEHAINTNGKRDSRHRIEHIETIEPEDVPRLSRLGAVGSMQPTHPPGIGDLPLEPYLTRIGEKRWPLAFAWRTIKDTGVTLVHGTDWPVTPLNPLACIEGAMTRKVWKEGMKDERLSLTEILEGYIKNGAWVEFMEDRKGVLKPGYLADIVVLSGNIEAVKSEAIGQLEPTLTICDGKVTYEKPN